MPGRKEGSGEREEGKGGKGVGKKVRPGTPGCQMDNFRHDIL